VESVRKITFGGKFFAYLADGPGARGARANRGKIAMTAKALSSLKTPRRLAAAIGVGLTLASATSALAVGTPEQRRACTPDVYRLCAGEIPNVGAITACLHRHKGSLSSACRAAMDQAGQ
jgi:hypothetical protein